MNLALDTNPLFSLLLRSLGLNAHLSGSINRAAPVGGRPLLHRGQAPARGTIIGPSTGPRSKPLSARRLHRYDAQVRREFLASVPGFSAQIAAEEKQARGRAARAARMTS